MRKILLAGMTALSFVTVAPAASAYPHDHRYYGGGGGGYYRGGHHGDAVAAGVAGIFLGTALGLALSEPREPRYYGPPPGSYGGYNNGYSYDQGPQGYYPQGQCFRRELRWDPRVRANVEVTTPYPC